MVLEVLNASTAIVAFAPKLFSVMIVSLLSAKMTAKGFVGTVTAVFVRTVILLVVLLAVIMILMNKEFVVSVTAASVEN